MNSCCFFGRLTNDVELKQTQNGVPVCSFVLAVDRPNVKETADFINFVAWRQTAEFISRYFKKGNKIAVSGVLTSRKYQDQNGKNHVTFEVVVDRAEFCESKTAQNMEKNPTKHQEQPKFEELSRDEELPF